MNKAAISLIAALAALSSCGPAAEDRSAAPPLAGAAIGAPFTLTDQEGREFSSDRLAGKYRIVYFGYTYCPDVCPVDLARLMKGYRRFEQESPAKAEKVQPLFISIDPERDTPEALKQYVAAFHPRLIGLTGSSEDIAEVAKAHAIYYDRAEQEGASDYLVDHSRQAYLFGPEGEPLALLSYDGSPERIAAELDEHVS